MKLPPHEIHFWLTHAPVSTRAFIRDVLSHYLDKAPQHIGLRRNIHGKPLLKDRRIDLLLIDDMQFLQGKSATEFGHTLGLLDASTHTG